MSMDKPGMLAVFVYDVSNVPERLVMTTGRQHVDAQTQARKSEILIGPDGGTTARASTKMVVADEMMMELEQLQKNATDLKR
jgi:hypothetical protein